MARKENEGRGWAAGRFSPLKTCGDEDLTAAGSGGLE